MGREQLVRAAVYVISIHLLGAVGCQKSAPPPKQVRGSFHRIEQRMGDEIVKSLDAHWARCDGPLELLILCDFSGTHGSGSEGSSSGRVGGRSTAADGRVVTWEWQTTDGKSGTIVINGQKYDRAVGGLFLVYTKGDSPRVVQLNREFSGGREILDGLADADPDIKAFVAEADAWMP